MLDLDAIERRARAATPGPWKAWLEGRDHLGGDSTIITGAGADKHELEVRIDGRPAGNEDLDFIANARQDVLALVAALRGE
jgi:hypothetical protein